MNAFFVIYHKVVEHIGLHILFVYQLFNYVCSLHFTYLKVKGLIVHCICYCNG